MSLDALIMLFGALVALLPFLGFPNSWDRILLLILGIIIVILGIVVRRRGSRKGREETPRMFAEATSSDASPHEE